MATGGQVKFQNVKATSTYSLANLGDDAISFLDASGLIYTKGYLFGGHDLKGQPINDFNKSISDLTALITKNNGEISGLKHIINVGNASTNVKAGEFTHGGDTSVYIPMANANSVNKPGVVYSTQNSPYTVTGNAWNEADISNGKVLFYDTQYSGGGGIDIDGTTISLIPASTSLLGGICVDKVDPNQGGDYGWGLISLFNGSCHIGIKYATRSNAGIITSADYNKISSISDLSTKVGNLNTWYNFITGDGSTHAIDTIKDITTFLKDYDASTDTLKNVITGATNNAKDIIAASFNSIKNFSKLNINGTTNVIEADSSLDALSLNSDGYITLSTDTANDKLTVAHKTGYSLTYPTVTSKTLTASDKIQYVSNIKEDTAGHVTGFDVSSYTLPSTAFSTAKLSVTYGDYNEINSYSFINLTDGNIDSSIQIYCFDGIKIEKSDDNTLSICSIGGKFNVKLYDSPSARTPYYTQQLYDPTIPDTQSIALCEQEASTAKISTDTGLIIFNAPSLTNATAYTESESKTFNATVLSNTIFWNEI